MESQPQESGSGGRTGGPPLIACGYDDDDEGPRRNSRARRERRGPSTIEPPGFVVRTQVFLKSLVGEIKRLSWPNAGRFFEALILVVLGLAVLFAVAK